MKQKPEQQSSEKSQCASFWMQPPPLALPLPLPLPLPLLFPVKQKLPVKLGPHALAHMSAAAPHAPKMQPPVSVVPSPPQSQLTVHSGVSSQPFPPGSVMSQVIPLPVELGLPLPVVDVITSVEGIDGEVIFRTVPTPSGHWQVMQVIVPGGDEDLLPWSVVREDEDQ